MNLYSSLTCTIIIIINHLKFSCHAKLPTTLFLWNSFIHSFMPSSSSSSSSFPFSPFSPVSPLPMGRDEALQRSLVGLALLMVVVGFLTMSLKKVLATYAFGLFAVAGILLPDWEFFDRDFSHWFTPMPATRTAAADRADDTWKFKFHPLRVAVLTTIYGFGFYKWWMYISS